MQRIYNNRLAEDDMYYSTVEAFQTFNSSEDRINIHACTCMLDQIGVCIIYTSRHLLSVGRWCASSNCLFSCREDKMELLSSVSCTST